MRCSTLLAEPRSTHSGGPVTRVKPICRPVTARLTRSSCEIAHLLGTNSPKTAWNPVVSMNATAGSAMKKKALHLLGHELGRLLRRHLDRGRHDVRVLAHEGVQPILLDTVEDDPGSLLR